MCCVGSKYSKRKLFPHWRGEVMSTTTTPVAEPIKGVMSREEWQRTPEFLLCSRKQQGWLLIFTESGGDAKTAAQFAYQTSSEKSASDMAYQTIRNPHVKAALRLYQGVSEPEALLQDVQARLHAGTATVADIEGLKTVFAIRGWSGIDFSKPGKLAANAAMEPAAQHSEPSKSAKAKKPEPPVDGVTGRANPYGAGW
jgi:hypothetical protein